MYEREIQRNNKKRDTENQRKERYRECAREKEGHYFSSFIRVGVSSRDREFRDKAKMIDRETEGIRRIRITVIKLLRERYTETKRRREIQKE